MRKHIKAHKFLYLATVFAYLFFCLGLLHGAEAFTTKPVTPPASNEVEKPEVPKRQSLYWENTTEPHPERAPWSDFLLGQIQLNLSSFDSASDMSLFCPRYSHLTATEKAKAVGELFVAMSVYESGIKPGTLYRECNKSKCQYLSSGCRIDPTYGYCMPGGHSLDGGIVISRGLLQISLQSAQGYGCKVTVPNDLHDPFKNLECGVLIMTKQIKRTGGIAAASNYWSVIKPTNSKNHIQEIGQRVRKHAPKCV